ncbi:MAG: hypothetical protein WCP52_01840 [Bacteroidota bacterium]
MQKHLLKIDIGVALFMSFLSNNSFSQTRSLDSNIVISIGEYRPTVADANKINENPFVVDSTQKLPVKGYSISSQKINTGFDVTPIPAAQMVGEPLTKLYNALVKLGFGNYTTPYAEVWYNSLRSKDYAYGVRIKHLSSSATLKDFGFSGFSDNEINLYGKKFLKDHTLFGNFDYARNVVHFYGYDANLQDLSKDATVQRFNCFSANVNLSSHYTNDSRYNHEVNLNYYNLTDLYKASENNIKVAGFVGTKIEKEYLKVNGLVNYYNYKTAKDTFNDVIISINPNFSASSEKYSATIGINATMNKLEETKYYFYPNFNLTYNVIDNIIIPYIGATGGLHKNSYKLITDENPFVLSALKMTNTNQKYKLFGGIKGNITNTVSYSTQVSYASIGNMMLYVNDMKDLLSNRFNVIYDDAEELTAHGEVAYQLREKLRFSLRGDYYNYKMKTELRAWYTPQVKFTLTGNYNLSDKIVAKIELFYLDNQYYKTIENENTSKQLVVANQLKSFLDANIGGEYRYTKKLGFFININNIANVRYYRYSNYPSQRFSAMLGLSYSF